MNVQFACEGAAALEPRALTAVEALGEPTRVELELFAAEPLADPWTLVGRACAVALESALGRRVIHGVVRSVTCVASAVAEGARTYRLTMSSALAQLELRRDRRVFQHESGPRIVAALIEEAGLEPPAAELSADHPPLRYLTQYDEPTLGFLRRVCEREGFWYRFTPDEERERIALADDPRAAPDAPLDGALVVAEDAGLGADRPRAWRLERVAERRPGAVRARGYDFRNPALAIQGEAEGPDLDRATRRDVVAPGAATPRDATRFATVALEAARAGAERLRFRTSAFVICPGQRFELEVATDQPAVDAEQLCVRFEHRWRWGEPYEGRVESTPTRLPFRLAQRTPSPKISGVQSAVVTGPPGAEIHADADGCVRVRFHWDRTGPTDAESSLPVRVVHPNLGGSMLIPRVGWEVWVAFENGDPDRPFVIGRAYNGKHGPPVALPANKTMTVLSTSSSPGAGAVNSISYDDGAGKQGLHFKAGKGLTKNVGNCASAQTVADEKVVVDGSVTVSVGGNHEESVHAARVVSAPVQTISVGGNQVFKTPAAAHNTVGSEVVSCAVLMEQVGSPGGGLDALKKQAEDLVGGTFGGPLYAVAKTAVDSYEAYKKDGAKAAVVTGAKGMMGMVPGGDLVGDAIDVLEAGNHAPWQDDPKKLEQKEGAGAQENNQVGGAAAAGSGAAADGGGGNRVQDVAGAVSEAIGGALAVTTGGQSKWTTLGASSIAVGGPHATAAGKTSWLVGGASVHNTGAFSVTAATSIVRAVRALQTTAATLTVNAASGVEIAGATVNLTCGALNINGKLVLDAKGTQVVVDGSGLTIKGAAVTFDGLVNCKQSDRS